jgi:hypothetical protein
MVRPDCDMQTLHIIQLNRSLYEMGVNINPVVVAEHRVHIKKKVKEIAVVSMEDSEEYVGKCINNSHSNEMKT